MSIDVAAAIRGALGEGGAPYRLTVFGATVPDGALGAVQRALAGLGLVIVSSQFDSGAGFEANVWELMHDAETAPPSVSGAMDRGALRDALGAGLAGLRAGGLHNALGGGLAARLADGPGSAGPLGSGLEFAFVGAPLAVSGPKMLIMDVDSTLIQQEVIELLAARAGVMDQVRRVTEAAMRGELDFAQSLHERVATLAGLPESVITEVIAEVEFTPGAAELVKEFGAAGHPVAVVSGGFRQILEPLANELGLEHYLANELEIVDGTLTGRVRGEVVDALTKARKLRQWAAEHGIEPESVVAIGDGANDIDMLQAAGLGVAFRAKPALRDVANVCVDVPTLTPVRHFVELSQ